MKLHNSFEIICGGRRFYCENTVSSGLSQKFTSGTDYTKYLVFGTGTGGGESNRLSAYLGGRQTVLYAKNFDRNLGVFMIKKSIELSAEEFNGAVITEIGLSDEDGGTNLFNYALTGGITKPAGESLTVIATVYISDETACGACFCGGENPLALLLFSLFDYREKKFTIALSDCGATGTIDRQGATLYNESAAQVMVSDGSLNISVVMPENDLPEALLLIGASPALRLSAGEAEQITETTELLAKYGAADTGLLCTAEEVTFGGSPIEFYQEARCCGVSGVIKNPFRIILGEGDKACSGIGGKFAAVWGGESYTVYESAGGALKIVPFEAMDVSSFNILETLIDSGGNLYIRLAASPYIAVFRNVGGTLIRCNEFEPFDQNIESFSISEYDGNCYISYMLNNGGEKTCKTYLVSFTGIVYYRQYLIKSVSGRNLLRIGSQESAAEIFYSPSGGFESSLGINLSDYIKQAIKECGGGTINGNLLMTKTGNKLRVFNLRSGAELQIYDSGVRKIYASDNAKMLVRLYGNNKMSGLYLDGNTGQMTRFEIDRLIKGEITDIKILGQEALIITAKNKYPDNYFIPLKKNTFIICPELKNNENSVISAQLTRRTFINKAGKRLTFSVRVSEV